MYHINEFINDVLPGFLGDMYIDNVFIGQCYFNGHTEHYEYRWTSPYMRNIFEQRRLDYYRKYPVWMSDKNGTTNIHIIKTVEDGFRGCIADDDFFYTGADQFVRDIMNNAQLERLYVEHLSRKGWDTILVYIEDKDKYNEDFFEPQTSFYRYDTSDEDMKKFIRYRKEEVRDGGICHNMKISIFRGLDDFNIK